MPKLITRNEIVEELSDFLRADEDDERLAWLASLFLEGNFRVVGDGIFERKRCN